MATFGPSKKQMKSYDGWDGCDGKLYKPFNVREKVGKISDFVTASLLAAKEKEKELEKAEALKKKEMEAAEKKLEKKRAKGKDQIVEGEEEKGEEDEEGFTTIEDKTDKQKMKSQNWQQ